MERLSRLRSELDGIEKEYKTLRNQFVHGVSLMQPQDDKALLIGKLPMVLLSIEYFPDNDSLISFSDKSLGLPMPKGHRSRKEIIGIIITEVAKLKPEKIEQFRKVLDQVMEKKPKGQRSFFEEWDKTIKEMRFK
jgi:hypothetical protein